MNTLDAARRIVLGGTPVDLLEHEEAVSLIGDRARSAGAAPLGVLSANVDHVNHFGHGGRWEHVLDAGPAEPAPAAIAAADDDTLVLVHDADGIAQWQRAGADRSDDSAASAPGTTAVEWIHLIDGSPLATQARRMTGRAWPRLAGSDLIGPLLDRAALDGVRVGVLGGSEEAQQLLRARLAEERPDLVLAGLWSPSREALGDPEQSRRLALAIRAAAVDLLVVGLGKPRQELWIAEHGAVTGARVLLAFGAAVDFLGGRVHRAPHWIAASGMEWLWRLGLEPRRLARRYLVEGPMAYGRLRRHSGLTPVRPAPVHGPAHPVVPPVLAPDGLGRFVDEAERAEVAVLVVTHDSAEVIDSLVAALREEARTVRLRLVIVDADSADDSLERARTHRDAVVVEAGGNVGYAGGINIARRHAGDADALLVLNPDLVVLPGAITRMLARLDSSAAGLVVPRIRDADGGVALSLRREPTRLRALGDAAFGARFPSRPDWAAETDTDPESYRHAHPVDWATGAAVLVDAVVAARLGDWDERFFLYSEETDYFRRARDLGADVWFEPAAEVVHTGGGSGGPSSLGALMAVNRVRYVEKFHSSVYSATFRAVVVAAEALRSALPGEDGRTHRRTAATLLRKRSWTRLPAATPAAPDPTTPLAAVPARTAALRGAVVIPAHDEESVILRTLAPLAPLAADGSLEVVVACNGCTDRTAELARSVPGVRVVEIAEPSKTAALNAGDAAASAWPRLYLDADIEIAPESLWSVFEALTRGGLLAARPASVYDTEGADPLVRAYYRARDRVPSLHTALWGAGGYGVSAAGHERLGAFPAVVADDVFVHGRFGARERRVIPCPPVVVRTPRTAASLAAVLRRSQRGVSALQREETGGAAPTTAATVVELLRSTGGPRQLLDALVYVGFALLSRTPATRTSAHRASAPVWTRDETSRRAVR